MAIPRNVFGQLMECILEGGARQATKYISERETVKATLRTYKRRMHGPRPKDRTIVVTVGPPNYLERRFIKLAKKAGEPFPIKKIQLKWPVERKVTKHEPRRKAA